MGFEPYTTEELLSYYQQNICELGEFDATHIYFVDNLQTIADRYGMNESCDDMKGFTIPFDGCIVAILNGMNGFDTMEALFHELTHVRDFIWFSRKYNTNNIHQHNLYYALRMYSEINAYFLGLKLTVDFLSKKNPNLPSMFSSMIQEETLQNYLCRKEMDMEHIFRYLGYILLYDDFHHVDDHMSHLPASVSLRLRGAIQEILEAYWNDDIEEIDSIIRFLAVRK